MKLSIEKVLIILLSIMIVVVGIVSNHQRKSYMEITEVTYVTPANTHPDYYTETVLYVESKDDVELLFDKFEFKYEYRDYFRQICILQNVDPILAISVARIETWAGNHPSYNSKSEERMYYTNGVKTWDLGLFQMSDYYADYWEEQFFNPDLIMSLGYIRERFELTDDYISIQIGVAYLGFLIKYYNGDTHKAVASYNCGYIRVANNTIPKSTKQYVIAIHNNYKFIDKDV